MSRPIVVVGSANYDLVCHAARIPSPGETIWGDRFETFHGGKGANQAVAAARLGAEVHMVGKVGDDDFGQRLRDGLAKDGVQVDLVAQAPGVSSGVALISVDAKGQNSIVVIPGANGELRPEDLERCRPRLESAGILLAQLEIPLETVEYLCRIARGAGVPLMLDPAPARAIGRDALRCVTYLTPNETETAILCGLGTEELTQERLERAAEDLLEMGSAHVLVKMGERGAFVASADGLRRFLPARKVAVVDTTAAGDAFNAGVATALMQGKGLEEAARYGMAVAAASVTRAGAQAGMPTKQEVAALLAQG